MVKRLHKASVGYPGWKLLNNPNYKPWHYPEQIMAPRIRIEEVRMNLSCYIFIIFAKFIIDLIDFYWTFKN